MCAWGSIGRVGRGVGDGLGREVGKVCMVWKGVGLGVYSELFVYLKIACRAVNTGFVSPAWSWFLRAVGRGPSVSVLSWKLVAMALGIGNACLHFYCNPRYRVLFDKGPNWGVFLGRI